MSKKKRPPQNRPQRRPKQRRPLRAVPQSREPDLLDAVSDALDDPSPLALLMLVSGLVDALDPRNRNPFEPAGPDGPTLDMLTSSVIDAASRETSALLTVIAALTPDEVLRRKIRRELATRRDTLPPWLARLDDAEPTEPFWITHVLGDGENIVVGLDIPSGGGVATISTYIDHNLGSVAKDAYPLDATMDEVATVLREHDPDPDKTIEPLDPATARARIADAIARGAMSYPPYETGTWPQCRPLLEWACRLLPVGGTGFDYREWTQDEQDGLVDQFLRSAFGAPFRDDPDAYAALQTIVWFGTGYSTLDPYRWSAPKLEMLLLDWIPRKIMDTPDSLARYPKLIDAYVRFAHDHVGLRKQLTDDAAAVIAELESEYVDIIGNTSRPQGTDALFAAMGLSIDVEARVLEAEVGGPEALAALDRTPLPDEPFDESGLDDALAARVRPIAAQLIEVVDDVFGAEARTACLRLLRRLAIADPAVITRAKRDDVTAAAVCWMIGQANELFDRRMLVKDVLTRFGVTGSVSQRAEAARRVLGLPYGGIALGSPDLLVAGMRGKLCELRDR